MTVLHSIHSRLKDGGSRPNLLAPVTVLILAYLVLAPLVMALVSSFKRTDGVLPFETGAPWSVGNYADVFLNSDTYGVLVNTLIFSVGSLALALVISTALAWLVERTDMPFRTGVFFVVVASIGIPGVVTGIAWVLLLNPTNGLVNLVIRSAVPSLESGPFDVFTMGGLIFTQSLTLVPVTFLLISAAFKTMDAALEEAGLMAGVSRRTVFFRITLPILAPALLGAIIYQFVNVVASFDLPLIIGLRGGIPLLSTQIFSEARPEQGIPDYGIASTYSIFLLALAFVPILIYGRLIARSERFATISGRGYRPSRVGLGRWKGPSLTFVGIFVLLNLGLPLFIMLWTSLQPFYSIPSAESLSRLSVAAYENVFTSPTISSVWLNTALVGGATALGAMTLGLLVAWIVVRTRSRLRFALDVVAFIPHALPGVIIGVSVLLLYLLLPLPLYGTVWIIAIGLTTQFIALATRLMTGGIVQVERQLEEAGEVSGASRRTVLTRVVLPLVLPTFLNGALLVFLISIQHLTVPLLLFTPDSIVLSTVIWQEWDHGDTATTAALGVITMALTVSLSIVLRGMRRSSAV